MSQTLVPDEVLDLAKERGKITGVSRRDGQDVHHAENPNVGLERKKREECLATWYHQATPGTTYWRCVVPARHLPGQALGLTPKDAKMRFGKIRFPRMRGDSIVWQFLGDEGRTRLAFGVRELTGKRLFVEVDDNYLRPAAYVKRGVIGHNWSETIAEAKGGYSNEMHRAVVRLADGVIASTEYLAAAYSEFNDNVHLCPNSVDPADWQYEREPHDTFRIVYYASSSHTWDTPLVTKALKWASRQKGVEVYLAGFQNMAWSFEHTKIPWIPWLDVAREQLFRFDLGIAPLKENAWANGKSDVKALEYAMAGVMPLMSRAEPYRPWSDWDPLLVDDGEWEEKIRWAVQNQDEVRLLAAEAKSYVLEERTIQKNIHRWREALCVAA